MVDRWRRVVSISIYLLLLFLFLLFDCTVQQQFSISRGDRLALLQLRSSLGIRAREWPLKSDPCVSWKGIQCSNGGRVTGINISGFRRTRRGVQNPQFSVAPLANLTLLSTFNAANFILLGTIPDWFGLQLGGLQVLDLRSCSISGSIPSTLGNLTTLVQLHLSGNNLTGKIPLSLSQLVRLRVLDLSKNSLGGQIPPGIGAVSSLQFLNLSANSLSFSIPAELGSLVNLVDLDLGFNLLSGNVPSDLSSLRNLQRMILGNNLLSGLPGTLFPSLQRLQFIVLRNNRFAGDLPNVLWSIPSLQLFDVSGNNFTGMLPNVSLNLDPSPSTVANISGNLFYGYITPVIRRFGFVDLSGNYFEGPVPVYARGRNTSLTNNCLRDTPSQRSLSECTLFYTNRSLVFDNFGNPNAAEPPPPPPPPPRSQKKRNRSAIIYGSVFGGIGFFLLFVVPVLLLISCKRKNGASNQRGVTVGPAGSPPPPGLPANLSSVGDAFTYKQILEMTGEFDDGKLIKRGHSGDLFWGTLEGGFPVVVKRIDLNSSVKKESYIAELDLFSRVTHSRFVPFLGHCLENENEKFLVYKCMPNGDLSSALFKKTTSDDGLQSLDWIKRLKIAIGAAEGLSYLHHECSPPLVHRDVQASSILLDDKFEVRLGSLSEVYPQEGDSHQNRITRLLRLPQSSDQGSSGTPNASCAYDVYCFGKVLLELVTGMPGISSSTDVASTKEWLEKTLPYISIYDKDLVTNIIDPSLIIDDDLLEEVWAMAIVARSCLNPRPARRPLMRYILKALENPLKVVREEHSSSARLRATSSRGSWNATTLFGGSWRLSSSDVVAAPAMAASRRVEHVGSFKQSGTTGSQGSGVSTRQHSKEIFPEPVDERGVI